MDHFKVLKRAFQITWKYRALWLIGLLLVFAGGGVVGGFGGPPGNPSSAPTASGDGEAWEDFPESFSLPEEMDRFWEEAAPILIAIGIILLLVLALAFVLGILKVVARFVARTSLIEMVDRYEESGEELRFWDALRLGWSRSAFQLFLINLTFKLPLALLAILSIGALVALAVVGFVSGSVPGIALGVLFILLLIPIALVGALVRAVLGPVIEVSHRACVLEGRNAWDAIRSGLGLIRDNLGATALQWLLLVGLRIAWAIVLIPVGFMVGILGVFLSGLPALLLGGLMALITASPFGFLAGLVVFIPLLIVLVGLPSLALTTAATVFHSVVWTLTYREFKAIADNGEDDQVIEVKAS
jgi:MFS family permease